MSASQYLTLVLRALGYTSGTDFQWDKAWELSDRIGLTDGRYNATTTNFTRGDVAIISNQSLSTPHKAIDYSYLAGEDFRTVRRQYLSAVALCGYAYAYTDLNGDSCVLTIVLYKIIDTYNVTTLHNLTKGTTIINPANYYNEQANRSYGNSKIHYWDLSSEVLEHQKEMLNAMKSVLQTGVDTGKGTFVSPDVLNQ